MKKAAHGFMYTFVAAFLFLTHHLSFADIAILLPKEALTELFRSRSQDPHNGNVWRSIQLSHKERGFYVCHSQDWLQTINPPNTTGVKELTLKVVYKHYEKSTKNLLNKTAFLLGVPTKNNIIHTFNASGILNRTAKSVTSIERVPVIQPKQDILIGPPDNKDCMLVYAVRITYNFCRQKTFLKVAHFPQTFAPSYNSLPLKVEGRCSYGQKKPVAYCNSTGEWWFNETLPCKCESGEVMTSSVGCIELSSIIKEVRAVRQSNTRATISWKQKTLPGIQYTVICKRCTELNCDQNCPRTVRLEERNSRTPGRNSSHITGLKKGHDYMLIVIGKIDAVNDKSWNKTSKQVELRALPEEVRNLSFASQNHQSVALKWLPPGNIDSTNLSYEIVCQVHCLNEPYTRDCKKLMFIPSRRNLVHSNVTITGFRNEGVRYVFKVVAKHRFYESSEEDFGIEWNFVAINYTEFKAVIRTVSKSFNVVDVVIGVSVLILAVIVTIIGTRFYNRWKRRKHTLNFDAENPESFTQCEVPLTDITTHYVDPSNYDSVENVLRKFTTKLNEKNLKTDSIIGEGEFGLVWKAYLEVDGDQITVAVKNLRSGLSTKLRRDFLAEASVMGQFKDPNVISLHGVVVKKNTVKIVMEYMSNGSLDQYLVKNNGRLTTLQLLGMARGIASGMKYLAGRNFIHRDLAARNILVDENLTCKVSDFGLTREICQTSNYETRGGKIPIRWTAPEVIKHRKSFIASDVWSYGVVLWEIMSFGQRPYWEWDNFQVLQEIETGYRLPAPLKCPKTVHSLMLHCWEKERTNRPTFSYILNKLDEWIRSPETIHNSPATKAKRNTVELIESQSPIHEWLESIKMGKYAPIFAQVGYTRLSQVVNLTEQDLSDMGITLVGHRHKIHQSIPLVT